MNKPLPQTAADAGKHITTILEPKSAGCACALIESGGFYAADIRSPEARLRYYAQVFPIVEVGATYYALPSEQNARHLVERTPPGFVNGVHPEQLPKDADERNIPLHALFPLGAHARDLGRRPGGALSSPDGGRA